VCWIYGWTRRLTVPAGACTHACIAARLRVIPWKLACTACCTSANLVWTSFALSGLWPKAELGSTHGIGLGVFYSVSEWNADKTRVDKVRYGLQSRLFRIDLCGRSLWRRLDLWRLDLVMRIPVTILTLDALQVLSRSQVTLELSMSMRIRPICKVYIHTCT
jgi:hypothetical protein